MWAGIALAAIFTIIKTAIRLHISNRLFIDDLLVYIALTILIVLGVLYTLVNDTIFEIILVGMGEMPPTPEFYARMTFFLKVQFAIIVLFWTALWAVKFSFLMYYKKLFIGLPGNMQKCWWAVSIFALCAYIGCWITQLTSCEPMSTYFNGQCVTPRDIYVSNLSLYYATSVDIICDVMSKLLFQRHNTPFRLLTCLNSYGTTSTPPMESSDQCQAEVCTGWDLLARCHHHHLRCCSRCGNKRHLQPREPDVVGALVYDRSQCW